MPGMAGDASRVVSESARMRPARTNPITVGAVANMTCVSPAISDCAAGPPPLNWTDVNCTPATDSNSAEEICGVEPYPADALNSFPGFAFAYETRSFKFKKGDAAFTTTTAGPEATREMATKSFSE